MRDSYEEAYLPTRKRRRMNFLKGLMLGIVSTLIVIGILMLIFYMNIARAGLTLTIGASRPQGSGGNVNQRSTEIANKLSVLDQMIGGYFLNDDEIDQDALVEGIYKGYVEALDEPYTVYYTASEFAELNEESSGIYSGIGVVVTQNVNTGVISVVRPFEGSPGEEAGIRKDDLLYKVGGREVTGVDLTEAVSWIKGPEGSTVEIQVYRDGELLIFNVERRKIEIPMTNSQMLDDHIGYIEVTEFEELTCQQFSDAVEALEKEGMEGLIIDLRDNPGGLVNSACDILDRILPSGKLLVYTMDKYDKKEEIYSRHGDSVDVPIVVLINGNTASSSEIMSGCLQDYEKATLVGTTSFGKGIVQYVLPLGDGSAIKITSASYYSPNGRNIHGTGIEPDVVVELDPDREGDEQIEKAQELLLEQIEH